MISVKYKLEWWNKQMTVDEFDCTLRSMKDAQVAAARLPIQYGYRISMTITHVEEYRSVSSNV